MALAAAATLAPVASPPVCGFEHGFDIKTGQSILDGRRAVVRIDMRQFGVTYLCARCFSKKARQMAAERGYLVTELPL